MLDIDPGDATAIHEAIAALYRAISGPPGARRDWSLHDVACAPGARCLIIERTANGAPLLQVLTMDEYRRSRERFLVERGFFEREVHSETSIRGSVAHVFSAFEARYHDDGPVVATGWNSIQLARLDGRWRIVNVLWEATAVAATLAG